MLTALEKGVKGGKWFSLVDKVYSSENLRASWEKVRSNGGAAGVDRQSIEAYEKEAEKNLVELEKILREGNYRAKPVKRVWIPKIGSKEKRPLGVPGYRLNRANGAKERNRADEQRILRIERGSADEDVKMRSGGRRTLEEWIHMGSRRRHQELL
jgi:hypothetical protein